MFEKKPTNFTHQHQQNQNCEIIFNETDTSRSNIANGISVLLAKQEIPKFEFDLSVIEVKADKRVVVAFQNRLGWSRSQIVSVFVSSKNVKVFNPQGELIQCQVSFQNRKKKLKNKHTQKK